MRALPPRLMLTAHLDGAHGIRLTRAAADRTTLAELAGMDPCALRQPAGGDLGRDASGYRVWRSADGSFIMDIRITECCGASAKGSMGAVVCRACYQEIDALIGTEPNPPFIAADGQVTGLTAIGWRPRTRTPGLAVTYAECAACSAAGGRTLHPPGYTCTHTMRST